MATRLRALRVTSAPIGDPVADLSSSRSCAQLANESAPVPESERPDSRAPVRPSFVSPHCRIEESTVEEVAAGMSIGHEKEVKETVDGESE